MRERTNQNQYGEIVTDKQAAERLNLGTTTVRKLAKESKSELKIGTSYRININKLINYVLENYEA